MFVELTLRCIVCLILNNTLRFLENYGRYGKMFQREVVWFGGGQEDIIDLTVGDVKIRSNYIDFLKWNTIFLIPEFNSW